VADCLHDVETTVSLPLEKWRAIEAAIRDRIRPLKQSIKEEIGANFISTAYGSPLVVESVDSLLYFPIQKPQVLTTVGAILLRGGLRCTKIMPARQARSVRRGRSPCGLGDGIGRRCFDQIPQRIRNEHASHLKVPLTAIECGSCYRSARRFCYSNEPGLRPRSLAPETCCDFAIFANLIQDRLRQLRPKE
jgi:hypothetical protein